MKDSDEEKQHYRRVSALIYAQNPHSHERMNTAARKAVAIVRKGMPEGTPEEVTKIFLDGLSRFLAAVLSAPMSEGVLMMEELFHAYTLAAASVTGAIDLGEESPAEAETTPAEGGKDFDQIMEEIINRQYLLWAYYLSFLLVG